MQKPHDSIPSIPGLDTALIRQSLDAGEMEAEERLVHSAKGVSGNIGATGLQMMAASADLEKAFQEGQSPADIEPTLGIFAEAHTTFINLLKQALPSQEDSPAEVRTFDSTKATDFCWNLLDLLEDDDSRAIKVAKEERELLRSLLGVKYFQLFENAINQYDFEEALEI